MYGDSQALSTDSISTPIFPEPKGERLEDLSNMNINQNEYRQYQPNSGLLRFRSAPTSLFDKVNDPIEGFLNHMPSSPDLGNGFSLSSQLPPHYPRQSSTQVAMGSSLMRQSSSPAGLFSHLNAQNGFATLRDVGNYRVGNGGEGDLSPSSSLLKSQMSFASGVPSSLGMLSRISEIEGDVGESEGVEAKLGSANGDTQFYNSEYPFGSWNNSIHFTENFAHLKRELDDDGKLFSGAQNGELGNRVPILSHHLSLPKTSAEMDNLLQFHDSVPCKIRAKRGCATHPRSIAERVRRTRISERMRKLQELVPNMDKQTNTADMLDLAVEYIKNLQKEFKTLSNHRANCKCSSMQKSVPN